MHKNKQNLSNACYLARSFARSIKRYLSMRYIQYMYTYMQRRSLASEIVTVQHKRSWCSLK